MNQFYRFLPAPKFDFSHIKCFKPTFVTINKLLTSGEKKEGLDFMKLSVYFANIFMSCLCIHLVTLFNLPCKHIFVMEYNILCCKT